MDKKAKKILFNRYWASGWKSQNEIYTSPEDFAYAKEKGLMFDPITISHNDCIKRIVKLANTISMEKVVKAFLQGGWTGEVQQHPTILQSFLKNTSIHLLSRDVFSKMGK